MSFTKVNAAGIGTTQPLTLSGANLSGVITASGLYVTGISTFTGNVSIGGTLTYEDTTNVDSIGLITARNGIRITGGSGLDLTGSSGIITATTYKVGAAVTISSGGLEIAGVTTTQSLKVGTAGTTLNTTSAGNVNISGKLGVGIANPIITGVTIENASVTQGLELETTNGFASGPTVRGYYRTGSSYKPLGLTGSEVVFGIQDVEKARLDSSGRFGIGTTTPATKLTIVETANADAIAIRSADSNYSEIGIGINANINAAYIQSKSSGSGTSRPLAFYGALGEWGRFDTSGRLLIGTTSTSTNASMILQGYAADGNDGGILRLATGQATPASGNVLGYINFTDSSHLAGSQIRAERDGGTWSASSKPGRLIFLTAPDGSATLTERMRISQNGQTQITSASQECLLLTSTSTSSIGYSANTLTIGRSERVIAQNTTTTLGNSYWGSLYLISVNQESGQDVQYTFVVTNAWSSASVLFSQSYGQNTITFTWSASSGNLQVSHNSNGSLRFRVHALLGGD